MVDMKMGGGDESDRPEGSLQGMGAVILDPLGRSDAPDIDNHQTGALLNEVRIG